MEELMLVKKKDILERVNIIDEASLDFNFNKRRKCGCDCFYCQEFDKHPVAACRKGCLNSEQMLLQDYIHDEEMEKTCECGCDFCTSGVTVHVHKKLDCLFSCEFSKEEDLIN